LEEQQSGHHCVHNVIGNDMFSYGEHFHADGVCLYKLNHKQITRTAMFFIEKVILSEAHYINTVTWTFCCKKVTFYSITRCESSYLSYSDVIKHDNLSHKEVFHIECIQYEKHKIRISLNCHELRCDV